MLIEQIINGISLGSLYVLFALGLTIVYSVLKLPWFAYAVILVYGGYFTYSFCFMFNLNFWYGMIIGIILCILISVILERLVVRFLYNIPHFQTFVAIFGIYMCMQYISLAIWGASAKPVPSFTNIILTIGSIRVPLKIIVIATVGIITISLLHLLLKKTKFGKAIRAVSQNYETAGTLGINIHRVRTGVFFISGLLAGVSGAFFGTVHTINPFIADFVIMKTFVVIVLGGISSIRGCLISGYFVGILESLIAAYVSSDFRDAILFGIIILIMFIRPSGFIKIEGRE